MAENLVTKEEEKAANDKTKNDILKQIAKRDPREQFKAAGKETILEMKGNKKNKGKFKVDSAAPFTGAAPEEWVTKAKESKT